MINRNPVTDDFLAVMGEAERNQRRAAAREARNRLFPIWSLPGRQLANCSTVQRAKRMYIR